MPAPAPLHPWKWPENPWHRVHIDYAGPIEGKMCLVVIDAHSKWIEVCPVASANGPNTVEQLRKLCATHGIPVQIVSDNGSHFVNEVFQTFVERNGIQHIRVAPYHPASNGMAERAVQTVKSGLAVHREGSLETRISRLLFTYRRLPQSTTGKSPAELLMGRRLRARLDVIRPNLAARVELRQSSTKSHHDNSHSMRAFSTGEPVYISTPNKGWDSGLVSEINGPLSYTIKLNDGRQVKRHVDHIRKRSDYPGSNQSGSGTDVLSPDESFVETSIDSGETGRLAPSPPPEFRLSPDVTVKWPVAGNTTPGATPRPSSSSQRPVPVITTSAIAQQPICSASVTTPVLRRSNRVVRPPDRFGRE